MPVGGPRERSYPSMIITWTIKAMREAPKATPPTTTLTSPAGWAAAAGATVMALAETDFDVEAGGRFAG